MLYIYIHVVKHAYIVDTLQLEFFAEKDPQPSRYNSPTLSLSELSSSFLHFNPPTTRNSNLQE